MKLRSIFVAAVFLIPLYASAQDKAEVFSGKSVASQLQALAQTAKASASGGATLGDYGSHAIKLSVRITSGGAEVHAHYDDVFVVSEGTATLVTERPFSMPRTARMPAGIPYRLNIAPE